MSKLLSANFSRIRKDKVFWFVMLFMFGLGVFSVCTKYSDIIRYNEHEFLDDALFVYVTFAGGCTAVFCSMFFGTEYSDGTIRNKLIVGHLRSSIYAANWVTSIVTSIIMGFAFVLSYSVLGSFLLESPQASIEEILFNMFISLFTVITYASIFNAISMLSTKKIHFCNLMFVGVFGLLFCTMIIKAKLDAPEFVPGYEMTINGVEQVSSEPNPKFLQPMARKIYQFFFDLLPTGQSIQISAFDVMHPVLMMIYSVVVSVITTMVGAMCFSKKNLK